MSLFAAGTPAEADHRRRALDELVTLAEEDGLYDDAQVDVARAKLAIVAESLRLQGAVLTLALAGLEGTVMRFSDAYRLVGTALDSAVAHLTVVTVALSDEAATAEHLVELDRAGRSLVDSGQAALSTLRAEVEAAVSASRALSEGRW